MNYGSVKDLKSPRVSVTSTSSDLSDEIEIPDNDNPFIDPAVEDYYRRLYESSGFNCLSEFDPRFNWFHHEEEAVVRKLDRTIGLFACITFVGLQLDRGNLQQAISDNFLNDLNLSNNNYNLGGTIFQLCFLLGELPCSLLANWFGLHKFIPLQAIAWSVLAMAQCLITGKKSFLFFRATIALVSSGCVPELVLWLSRFYKSSELSIRLSWLWTTLSLVEIFSAFSSLLILRLRGTLGLEGWRWLFMIDGSITLFIGIATSFMIIESPLETKSIFAPNGWYSEREIKIIVNRVLRDDPSKADKSSSAEMGFRKVVSALFDPDLVPIYIIGLVAYIPTSTLNRYFPILLQNLNYSTSSINLLLIPNCILHMFMLLKTTRLSERFSSNGFVILVLPLWLIPLFSIIAYCPGSLESRFCTWLLITVVLGAPYIHAICVSWVSRNAGSTDKRTISSAVYNCCVQFGGLVSANVFRDDDAPLYKRGSKQLFYLSICLVPLFLSIKFYYDTRNKSNRARWNQLNPEQQAFYLHSSEDESNKRLNFKFRS